MVGRGEARPGLDDRRRARRTGRRPGRARSRSGRRRGPAGCVAARGSASPLVGPRRRSRRCPAIGRPLRDRADRDDDVRARSARGVVPSCVTVTTPRPVIRRVAAIDDGARLLERRGRGSMSSGSCGVGRPVDHVVALGRGARPLVAGRGSRGARPRRASSDFDGRQPMCGQLPPNQRRSTIATVAPSSRALCAAASPAGPAPMMTKSKVVLHRVSLPAARDGRAAGAPRRAGPPPTPRRSGCRRRRASAGGRLRCPRPPRRRSGRRPRARATMRERAGQVGVRVRALGVDPRRDDPDAALAQPGQDLVGRRGRQRDREDRAGAGPDRRSGWRGPSAARRR